LVDYGLHSRVKLKVKMFKIDVTTKSWNEDKKGEKLKKPTLKLALKML